MTPLPITETAEALGVHVSTIRDWVARGAPVARAGRPGRGGRALFDPEALRRWRDGQPARRCGCSAASAVAHGDAVELARGLGEAIGSAGDLGAFAGAAGALVAASDLSDLPDRLAELAGECPGDAQELARGWYLGCQWLADRGLVAEPSALPPSIRSLLSGC